jgi:N-acetylmuramoyl-L-alanine amidase
VRDSSRYSLESGNAHNMFTRRLVIHSLGMVAAGFALGPGVAWGRARITDLRLGESGAVTRLVFDMSEPLGHQVYVLPDPYRLVIDLPEVDWSKAEKKLPPKGQVLGVRYGTFRPGTARVVLDLKGPVAIRQAVVLPPQDGRGHRFVLDVQPSDRATFLAAGRPPPVDTPAPQPTAKPPKGPAPRRADGKRVVVLDPGHGGVDPGTTGYAGTYEKDVTLDIALDLAKRLKAGGKYHVLLTRDDDYFVRLRERVRFAREHDAELFVSLHADSLHDSKVRGATVYTLSDRGSDAVAEALAAKENRADSIAGIDLSREKDDIQIILFDLAQRETRNHSAKFAGVLVPEIGRAAKVWRDGRRSAAFAVLKAPDVPSVLVEMGYLSNRQDERFLTSPKGRKAIVDALARGIDRYFATTKA